jgi:hypothetical protein
VLLLFALLPFVPLPDVPAVVLLLFALLPFVPLPDGPAIRMFRYQLQRLSKKEPLCCATSRGGTPTMQIV